MRGTNFFVWMGMGMDGMGFRGESGGIWCFAVEFWAESALRIFSVLCGGKKNLEG